MVFNFNPLVHIFINAHLAIFLIWLKDTTAKGAKNAKYLQYSMEG